MFRHATAAAGQAPSPGRQPEKVLTVSSRPDYFSRIVVLWHFLGFYLVQSQSRVFAIYSLARHNFFRRNNLTSSNPVACLGKANPGRKILWTICRISVRPFDQIVKAGNSARPKTVTGEIMPQYLVAIHHPDDYDPSVEDEAMGRDIDVLNEEMIAAGIRVFVGGLHPVKSAKSLRAQPGGKVLITDGPYLETKEHIGGFWVLEATDMKEALEWGRKAVVACRAPVEVRQFHSL
jgi:hypothetical protein